MVSEHVTSNASDSESSYRKFVFPFISFHHNVIEFISLKVMNLSIQFPLFPQLSFVLYAHAKLKDVYYSRPTFYTRSLILIFQIKKYLDIGCLKMQQQKPR